MSVTWDSSSAPEAVARSGSAPPTTVDVGATPEADVTTGADVTTRAAAAPSALPFTGIATWTLLAVAALTLIVGSALIRLGRRQRLTTWSAPGQRASGLTAGDVQLHPSGGVRLPRVSR